VELAYAKQNNLPVAHVKNAAGKFIAPTIESLTAAANGAVPNLPPDTDYRVSIVNSPDPSAYPIASFTWLLVYERQPDAAKGQKLVDFMKWAMTEGEASAAALDYAALPPSLVPRLMERLATIKIGPTS
jgi:phosphate transport system substrate-binding protein